jgi:putative ABC transport system substrate-binding protein
MVSVGDPVGFGFVKSLARPEGNITGMSSMGRDLHAKQMEMPFSMVPKLSGVALLLNPSNPGNIGGLPTVEAAARTRGIKILRADAQTPQEIDNAFSWMRQQNARALLLMPDAFFQQQKNQIVQLAAKHRLPTMGTLGEYTEAGGLMSYGVILADQYLRVATYVGKILKGSKPGDLPVEQPTKFELIINRKTAKSLGLTIPQSLLISADKVIE